MSEKIVLIDGHSIINRAFYGVPDLTNKDGLHTNGIFGFVNILFKIIEEEKPQAPVENKPYGCSCPCLALRSTHYACMGDNKLSAP